MRLNKEIIRSEELVTTVGAEINSARKEPKSYFLLLLSTCLVSIYNTNGGIFIFTLILVKIGYIFFYLDVHTQDKYDKNSHKLEKNLSCYNRMMEKRIKHVEKKVGREVQRREVLMGIEMEKNHMNFKSNRTSYSWF